MVNLVDEKEENSCKNEVRSGHDSKGYERLNT